MKYYDLRLNENQMRILQDVCELRFRIDLLQENELAEILATMNCLDLSPKNPNHEKIFDYYIERREHLKSVIKALYDIASPWRSSNFRKRDPDSLVAQDIFEVIRHQLWLDNPNRDKIGYTVDSREPLQMSDEPLPSVRQVENESM